MRKELRRNFAKKSSLNAIFAGLAPASSSKATCEHLCA
jgi:hypothetical protein